MPRAVHARTTVKSNLSLRNRKKRFDVRRQYRPCGWINTMSVQAQEKRLKSPTCQTCSFKPFHSINQSSVISPLAPSARPLSDSSAFVVGVSLFRSAGLWS